MTKSVFGKELYPLAKSFLEGKKYTLLANAQKLLEKLVNEQQKKA